MSEVYEEFSFFYDEHKIRTVSCQKKLFFNGYPKFTAGLINPNIFSLKCILCTVIKGDEKLHLCIKEKCNIHCGMKIKFVQQVVEKKKAHFDS